MLRPVSSREIVARMVRNLIAVFNPRDIGSEAEILSGYLDITKRSAVSPATTRSRV